MIFFRNWKKFTNKKKQTKTMQLYSIISCIMYGNKMKKLENRTKSNIPQIILKVGMNDFYFTYIKYREDYIYSKVPQFLGFTIICIITTRPWTIKLDNEGHSFNHFLPLHINSTISSRVRSL